MNITAYNNTKEFRIKYCVYVATDDKNINKVDIYLN